MPKEYINDYGVFCPSELSSPGKWIIFEMIYLLIRKEVVTFNCFIVIFLFLPTLNSEKSNWSENFEITY